MVRNANRLALKLIILEDDYLIATDLQHHVQMQGASVIGPFSSIVAAKEAMIDLSIDGAILDAGLDDGFSFSFADFLLERGLPFIFLTGFGEDHFPDHLKTLPRIEKPFSTHQLLAWLKRTFTISTGEAVRPEEPLSNLLLNSFGDDELARLRPHLLRVGLKRRSVLQRSDRLVERVYFPETAIGSMLVGKGDKLAEVGMIGREGVMGFPLSETALATPVQFIVQAEGDAIAVATKVLYAAASRSRHVAGLLYRFQYVLSLQIAYTALAHAAYSVEQRLARWLLMYDDRLGQTIYIVHEFLSLMLHVRRPSVTLAIQRLEAAGAIRKERGQIVIVNRDKLLQAAGASYGVPEKEYTQLFPVSALPQTCRYAGSLPVKGRGRV